MADKMLILIDWKLKFDQIKWDIMINQYDWIRSNELSDRLTSIRVK